MEVGDKSVSLRASLSTGVMQKVGSGEEDGEESKAIPHTSREESTRSFPQDYSYGQPLQRNPTIDVEDTLNNPLSQIGREHSKSATDSSDYYSALSGQNAHMRNRLGSLNISDENGGEEISETGSIGYNEALIHNRSDSDAHGDLLHVFKKNRKSLDSRLPAHEDEIDRGDRRSLDMNTIAVKKGLLLSSLSTGKARSLPSVSSEDSPRGPPSLESDVFATQSAMKQGPQEYEIAENLIAEYERELGKTNVQVGEGKESGSEALKWSASHKIMPPDDSSELPTSTRRMKDKGKRPIEEEQQAFQLEGVSSVYTAPTKPISAVALERSADSGAMRRWSVTSIDNQPKPNTRGSDSRSLHQEQTKRGRLTLSTLTFDFKKAVSNGLKKYRGYIDPNTNIRNDRVKRVASDSMGLIREGVELDDHTEISAEKKEQWKEFYIQLSKALPASETDKIPEGYRAGVGDNADGDAEAQFIVAYKYFKGTEGPPKNREEAVMWWKRAASSGHAMAMYNLGQCHMHGMGGLKVDNNLAAEWLRKSADKGIAEAHFQLGFCYVKGMGVEVNRSAALIHFQTAADGGSAGGLAALGQFYLKGISVIKDEKQGITYLTEAAKKGHIGACKTLAAVFHFGTDATEVDLKRAFSWYLAAANLGDADSCYTVGKRYYNGEIVGKDKTKALNWWFKAATSGCIRSQYSLASCLFNGDGTRRDYSKASFWYKKAAMAGHVTAQYSLGFCYERGLGVDKDEAVASEWYLRAAKLGKLEAMFSIATCYFLGKGVGEDKANAIFWYKKAAQGGHPNSKLVVKQFQDAGEIYSFE